MSKKLDDPKASTKSYWSIENNFLNNMKIANILPLKVNDVLISNFNICFAAQCSPISNSRKLLVFNYKTEHRLNYFEIDEDHVYLIIKNINSNKAHGWDNDSILW